MNKLSDVSNFKEIIDKLLNVNLSINAILLKDQDASGDEVVFDQFQIEFEELLKEKDILIEELKSIKQSCSEEVFGAKKSEFKEIWQKVQELENENLEIIKNGQRSLAKENIDLKNQSKMISSYKFDKENNGSIVDNFF